MIKEILKKVKDASFSIFPIVCIIIVLFLLSLIPNVFPTINNEKLIETDTFLVFLLCSIFLLLGFVLFDIGAENALAKVGSYVGANISKRGNIIIIAFITVLLGILIAIAEPDLSILSDQIGNSINPWVFKLAVGIGQGVYFFVAILRILFNKSCKHLYLFCYLIVFAIGCFYGPGKDASAFISLSFDTAGVSTGAATIPFVIAFGASFASTRGGKDQSSNSFGYAGLMSVGPVTIMLLMCLLIQNDVVLSNTQELQSVTQVLSDSLLEVLLGIAPIFIFFIIYNLFFLRINKLEFIKIFVGFLFAYIGLYCFVCSAKIGFIPLGYNLGQTLAKNENLYYLYVLLPLIIGIVLVLAEPSIHILNEQVEEISGGVITKKGMMLSLGIGVSLAITLEVCRIVFWGYFSVLYIYVPLLLITLLVAVFVDDIYVALAFDSGGAASGTLCVCFILPFVLGTIEILNEQNGTNYSGFGISGIVSIFPILSVIIMGLIAKIKGNALQKRARRRVYDEQNDAQIIHF